MIGISEDELMDAHRKGERTFTVNARKKSNRCESVQATFRDEHEAEQYAEKLMDSGEYTFAVVSATLKFYFESPNYKSQTLK